MKFPWHLDLNAFGPHIAESFISEPGHAIFQNLQYFLSKTISSSWPFLLPSCGLASLAVTQKYRWFCSFRGEPHGKPPGVLQLTWLYDFSLPLTALSIQTDGRWTRPDSKRFTNVIWYINVCLLVVQRGISNIFWSFLITIELLVLAANRWDAASEGLIKQNPQKPNSWKNSIAFFPFLINPLYFLLGLLADFCQTILSQLSKNSRPFFFSKYMTFI